MFENMGADIAATASYSAVGVVLMAVGFAVVDLLTPGNLRTQVWIDRNRNAAILVASNLLGVAIIVVAAITASAGDLAEGLVLTVVYTAIGLLAMALAFLLLDALTPGKLGEMLIDERPHPAVWVSAASHIGIGLVIAAALW